MTDEVEEMSEIEELNEAYDRLKEGMQIDRNALDDELCEHPHKFQEVGECLTAAIDLRDYCKAQLSEATAQCADQLRAEAAADEVKISQAKIDSQVPGMVVYKEALDELNETKRMANDWLALKESYEQRAKAIRELCQLYIAGYWTTMPVKQGKKTLEDGAKGKNDEALSDKRTVTRRKIAEKSTS